ncbi:MAG: Tpl protein [Candidatus Cloacimonetes bacterium]|nr:Tpl protein [Candidatus Cloacimonadota bacterium]
MIKKESDIEIDQTEEPIIESDEGQNEFVEVEMRTWKIAYFQNPNNVAIQPNDEVVLEVDRGQDIGTVMHTAVRSKGLDQMLEQGKIMSIVRCMVDSDQAQLDAIYEKERLATEKFFEIVEKYPFEMKLLDTVYQFDGNKVTFFFSAEGRIDFRVFVRELAEIFKTRIELHQCTGRDEAKKLGGYGMCGNQLCCSVFMKRFNQVTIKMAKDQNLSGNLSKISGPCGRLLCCLHYEEDHYAEVTKDFPEMGDEIYVNGKKMYVFRNDLNALTIHLTSESKEITSMTLTEYKDHLTKKQNNKGKKKKE